MPTATAAPPRTETKPALDWTSFVRDYCIATAQSRGIAAFSSQSMPATIAACRNAFKGACELIAAGPGGE